jgi:lipoate-protein ligase A
MRMIQPPPAPLPPAAAPGSWVLSRRRASTSALVATELGGAGGRAARVCEVTSSAFVLGSTQPESDVDPARAAAAGVEVCRRRAGGGGVLVQPEDQIWLDVFVPAGDRLWTPDVGRAFLWLGEAVAAAVRAVSGDPAEVHDGGLVTSAWSSVLCFSGLGAGEVTVEGRKVLGISQRRDRRGAWLRAMVLLRHVPEETTALLSVTEAARAEASECLRGAAGAVEADPLMLQRALLEAIAAS